MLDQTKGPNQAGARIIPFRRPEQSRRVSYARIVQRIGEQEAEQEPLQSLIAQLAPGNRLWPYQCDDAAAYLQEISDHATALRLMLDREVEALLPDRLSLLLACRQVSTQANTLATTLQTFRETCWTTSPKVARTRASIYQQALALQASHATAISQARHAISVGQNQC